MLDLAIIRHFKSRSLGISRNAMPQIKSGDVPDFLRWLENKHGVQTRQVTVPAAAIKHVQDEINPEKAREMMRTPETLKKRIIMSDDGYILDGHHRHVAQYMTSPRYPTPVYRVGIGIEDLLEMAKTYPKTFTKALHETFAEYLERTTCHCGCDGAGDCED